MYIASIASDVKIHTWPSGQLVNTYKAGGQSIIRTVSWGKDGNWLVVVPTQGPAEIIVIRENVLKHLFTIEDIQQPTCAVFQNLTKRNIALGTNTGNVLVYDIKSKSIRKHFPRAASTVFRVEYGMKDNYLVAACENGEILTFNSSTMNCSGSYKVPNSKSVSTIRTHICRRNLFMAGSEEGVVAVWDVHRNSVIHKNVAHQAIVSDVSFSPIRHDLVVSCGLDRKFVFWDTTSNGIVLQKIMDRSPTAIDFCPDGIGLAVGTQSGSIYTYDTRRMNDPMYSFKAHHTYVKQILFEKNCLEESGDYGLVNNNHDSGDAVAATRIIDPPVVTGYDSFGSVLCDITSPNAEYERPTVKRERDSGSDIQQDSFLDAMGMTSNSLRDSHCGPISKGVRKLLNSKPNLLDSATSDQSPQASREQDRSRHNRGADLRRVRDDIREAPMDMVEYREYTRSSPQGSPREYLRGDCGGSGRPDTGDHHRVDVQLRGGNRRQSYDHCQQRRPDYAEEQAQHHLRLESAEEPPPQDQKTYEEYHPQGQQRTSLTVPKHRQLERVVPPVELKGQSTSDETAPMNVPVESTKTQNNSTPKVPVQPTAKAAVPVHISPIISQAPPRPVMMEIAEFHNIVRQVVKQEVKDQLDSFHQSLKYDIMEVLAQIRRNFLDMQMSIVKEFVQLESSLNRVREDLTNDEGLTDELLIQENMRLRRELASLREQALRHKDQ